MGYAMADESLMEAMERELPEWNLSVISEEVMVRLAEEISPDRIRRLQEKIRAERDFLAEELEHRVERVYPSDSIYLLFRTDERLYDRMLERGILIRDCSDITGLGKGFFRVAVKDRSDNEQLLENMDEVLKWRS